MSVTGHVIRLRKDDRHSSAALPPRRYPPLLQSIMEILGSDAELLIRPRARRIRRRRSPGYSRRLGLRNAAPAPLRSLRRLSGINSASPKLRRLTEAPEPLRSSGETPSTRRDTEAPERRRTLGEAPKLRRDADPSERRRSPGEAPKLRRSTEAPEPLRRRGDSPKLRSRSDPPERHRRRGDSPELRRFSGASVRHRV
jgi:hypothetical protein